MITQSQYQMLDAIDLYWRAYDRGPDYDDLRVLTGAPDPAIGEMIYELIDAGLIARRGTRFEATNSGRDMILVLALHAPAPPELVNRTPDNFRSRPGATYGIAMRNGGVELHGPASSAAGTFGVRP